MTAKLILLVDDDPESREVLARRLSEKGFVVELASDGREAIKRVRNNKGRQPDLILMDIVMPIATGIEATQMLKSDPHTSAIPIIILSENIKGRQMSSALSSGCDDVCPKPFKIQTLVEKITALISSE